MLFNYNDQRIGMIGGKVFQINRGISRLCRKRIFCREKRGICPILKSYSRTNACPRGVINVVKNIRSEGSGFDPHADYLNESAGVPGS